MSIETGGGHHGGPAPAPPKNGPHQHAPPVELPSSNASTFYEEAKIGPDEEREIRTKFEQFAVGRQASGLDGKEEAASQGAGGDGGAEELVLTLGGFLKLLHA